MNWAIASGVRKGRRRRHGARTAKAASRRHDKGCESSLTRLIVSAFALDGVPEHYGENYNDPGHEPIAANSRA